MFRIAKLTMSSRTMSFYAKLSNRGLKPMKPSVRRILVASSTVSNRLLIVFNQVIGSISSRVCLGMNLILLVGIVCLVVSVATCVVLAYCYFKHMYM